MTVAGQGTAFGAGHVEELVNLGIQEVFLALDADRAGLEATVKIGDLFQKVGIAVNVVRLPVGMDPDTYLRDHGIDAFVQCLGDGVGYLTFLVDFLAQDIDMNAPAGKKVLIEKASRQIRSWNDDVVVHESLRQLAKIVDVPEDFIGVGRHHIPSLYVKVTGSTGLTNVDPSRILETDLLRWLIVAGHAHPAFVEMTRRHITSDYFDDKACRQLYVAYLKGVDEEQSPDLLTLAGDIDDETVVTEIVSRKINFERAEKQFHDTLQKLLNRKWMSECEAIRTKIASGQCTDDEALALVKEFDALKRNPPKAS